MIGTFLGGFYAYYFASVLFNSGVILINPVLETSKHLEKHLGKNDDVVYVKKVVEEFHDNHNIKFYEGKKEKGDRQSFYTFCRYS